MDVDLQKLGQFLREGGSIFCGFCDPKTQMEALYLAADATETEIGFNTENASYRENGHLRWKYIYLSKYTNTVHMSNETPLKTVYFDELSDAFPAEPPVYSVPDAAALLGDCGFHD